MMGNLGLEGQEIREQVICNIFMVFSSCFKLAINKHSINFLTNFMLSNNLSLKPYTKHL